MSDFLFARPSVLEGAARTIDLFGVLQAYNTSETPAEADARAFAADVASLREDFKAAWSVVARHHGAKA